MKDTEIADILIERLNDLIEDGDILLDIDRLVKVRSSASKSAQDHPDLQTWGDLIGPLGLLNGLIGTVKEGPLKGSGYIAACFDAEGKLFCFRRVDILDSERSPKIVLFTSGCKETLKTY